jgi:plasmid stability protein
MPAAITLKNIPDEIYERLKASASAHHRSLNMEAVACLEQVLLPTRATAQEHLARARQLRATQPRGKFKPTDIDRAVDRGRS